VLAAAPWLFLADGGAACRVSDHNLDALVSALVALAALRGLTRPPPEPERLRSAREGWIRLPSCTLGELGAGIVA